MKNRETAYSFSALYMGGSYMSKWITKRCRNLLAKEESFDVDFKVCLKGLAVDDLVAFANSPTGGTILIGVDEDTNAIGRQVGKVVGCKVGDNEKMIIMNKANECRPPVDITIYVENEDENPFYRIEIPSGQFKPYSTPKGTYLIRGDGRNLALNRDMLLQMFLDEQGDTFLNRFKNATEDLGGSVVETNRKLDTFGNTMDRLQRELSNDIDDITKNLTDLTSNVENNLEEIIQNTDKLVEETINNSMQTVNEIIDKINKMDQDIYETKLVTNKILEHLGIEHPYTSNYRNEISEFVKSSYAMSKEQMLNNYPDTRKEDIINEFRMKMIDLMKESYDMNHNPFINDELIIETVNATIEEINFSDLDDTVMRKGRGYGT